MAGECQVNLYSAGRTLLTDSGRYSGIPGAEFNYFRGTRAHNTVLVDDANQLEGTGHLGLTESSHDWLYQSAWHELYAGVTHRRAVVLLARDLVLVLDALDSTREHTHDQIWHFPPDATLRLEETHVTAVDESERPILAVRQAVLDPGLSIVHFRGQEDPMEGWYSEKHLVKLPSDELRFRVAGTQGRFATVLGSGPYAPAARRCGPR